MTLSAYDWLFLCQCNVMNAHSHAGRKYWFERLLEWRDRIRALEAVES